MTSNILNYVDVNSGSSWTDSFTYYPSYPANFTPSYSWIYTTPSTVYLYQVRCPECEKMNWLELDKITECKNCKSKLKAVSQKVDHEIQIED